MYVSIIGFVSPSDDKRNFVGCESWTKLSANKYDVLWNSESCRTLTSILNRYNAASGQCINRSKSAITFSSKTNMAAKIRVKEKLNISNEGGIEKYLGLPEHFARKKEIFSLRLWTALGKDHMAGQLGTSQAQEKGFF